MNKKFWLFAALCAGLSFTACTNDDEPQIEKPVTDNDWITPDGRVIVQLGGSSSKIADVNTATRAPLTPENANGQTIGVFALATTQTSNTVVAPNTEIGWQTETGGLLQNIKGTFNTTEDAPDGSEEGVTKITLSDKSGNGSGYLYYYPIDNKYTYTFYGYAPYADKTATTQYGVTCTGQNASIQYKKFDGSQDIMWDKAIAPIITKNSTLYQDETNLSDKVLAEDLKGYKAKYIRLLKYNAEIMDKTPDATTDGTRYNWVPNLALEHQLTQLRFHIVTASKQSSADKEAIVNGNGGNKLHVPSVVLLNHPQTATLDIPSGEITWSGNANLPMMMIEDGTKFTDNAFNPNTTGIFAEMYTSGENGTDVSTLTPDGYLLVNPKLDKYELEVKVGIVNAQNVATTDPQTAILELTPPTGGFKPGFAYNIMIGLYAMQEVEVTATVAPWNLEEDVIDLPVE